ncbi:MAG: peptidoglycan-binding protein [Lawsonibacter sp.]|nr:peptidoglycan-binding protein [Lawsonibacter sp.]
MSQDYPDRGNLQVSVSTMNDLIPIPDAVVRISDPTNGNVLEELTTDSSGQTSKIELPAPPEEYSVTGNGEKPYASYNVTVLAAERQTLHIGGVQVLPNSTALQQAPLRVATENGFNVKNILIEPHTLWGDFPPKIPEPEVKPLPEPTGLVVLDRPVVPEFVVVHLGVPSDASAQNVWVRFADYIKNVASSEIYSTWETETIKANVLAILSFALNRVFTEWYRGKGYEFTITNSTAYDQSFVNGRNVFEQISVIVDDLFTTYVTRENINQPLLTQYCDGKRTQCSGLSQWGSQSLGEQGYSAIDILRNFYGAEVYLASAEKVMGVPRSYGGTVLQLGSSGSAVTTIQVQLNEIANHFPAIPKNKENGEFDEVTQDAVRQFQTIFHLPVTGSVDFGTWYAISNVYVNVTKMAELR